MLTGSEQLLLLEILLKGEIKKSSQTIYKSVKFYEAMSNLKKSGLVNCDFKGNTGKKVYFLTYPKGWARANLIGFDHNVPKKYKNVSKEFSISR